MKTNLIRTLVTLTAVFALAGQMSYANSSESKEGDMNSMNLKLTFGDHVLTAALEDNATSRDFALLLPLTLTLKDYASTEKISDLPKRLSTQGAPDGSVSRIGDVTLRPLGQPRDFSQRLQVLQRPDQDRASHR